MISCGGWGEVWNAGGSGDLRIAQASPLFWMHCIILAVLVRQVFETGRIKSHDVWTVTEITKRVI